MCLERCKNRVEKHNKALTSMLALATFFLSLAALYCNEMAMFAAVTSLAMVCVQSFRRDSYTEEISKDGWTGLENGQFEKRIKLAAGFQMSPFSLFLKRGDLWEEVGLKKYYSQDGKWIVLMVSSEPDWEDAILVIGGPVSK